MRGITCSRSDSLIKLPHSTHRIAALPSAVMSGWTQEVQESSCEETTLRCEAEEGEWGGQGVFGVKGNSMCKGSVVRGKMASARERSF